MTSEEVATPRFRVAFWPDNTTCNPYQALFYASLRSYGVTADGEAVIDDQWLRRSHEEYDAIHLHWPESAWRSRGRSVASQLRGVAGLVRFLRLARRFNLRLMWTLHNLEHHEGVSRVDRLGYRVLARYMDVVICHSDFAASELVRRDRPRGEVVVVPHGNYDGAYPTPSPPSQTCRRVGLDPDVLKVGCIGRIRGYKGLDTALDAAREVGEKVQLVIAGSSPPEYDAGQLRSSASRLPNVVWLNRTLDNQEFADIVAACDVALLSYSKVTSSGALMAALTFGTPVIASDLPCFRDYADADSSAVTLFPVGDARELAECLTSLTIEEWRSRRVSARKLADWFSWDRTTLPLRGQLGLSLDHC